MPGGDTLAIKYGIFFTRDDQVIRLPINPEELPVARENNNTEYNVLEIGQISVPRIPKLKQITISSFFPGRIAPYVLTAGGFKEPEFYINFFESAMYDKVPILYTPVRYYENGQPFYSSDPGMMVLVTEFSTTEKGGETGDFYYDLTLQEYRDYTPKEVQIEQPASGSSESATATEENTRSIPAGQLYVGATCIVNGQFYSSSYGDPPYGNGNGRRCKVSRIITTDATRAYPVHITTESGGALGWVKKDSLQVVSTNAT